MADTEFGYKDESYYQTPWKTYQGHTTDPIETLDSPLIIEVAPCGSFIKRDLNPNQPYVAEEVADQVIGAINAGASMAHLHIRREDGIPDASPETIVKTIKLIQKEHNPITTINVRSNISGATFGVPLLHETIGRILDEYGSGYVDMVTTSPLGDALDPRAPFVMNPDILQGWVNFLQENGLKPELMAYSYKAYPRIKRWLVDTGILNKPYYINTTCGDHAYFTSGPTAPHPWGTLYLASMWETNPLPREDTVQGSVVGGRNWLPLTVESILMGYRVVRVGMEDAVYMYPHRDEKIETCQQVVETIVNICESLGREIATPKQARKILGI